MHSYSHLVVLGLLLAGCNAGTSPEEVTQDPSGCEVAANPSGSTAPDPVETEEQPSALTSPQPGTQAEDSPPEDLEVHEADTLYAEFEDNTENAIAKYSEGWLAVRGTVRERVHFVGNAEGSVVLTGTDDVNVVCEFPPEEFNKLKHAPVSQEITVHGKFNQKTSLQLWLESCKVAELGEDPTIDVDPVQLINAYLTDLEAASSKYKGKPIRFQSEIVRFNGESPIVHLEGAVDAEGSPVTLGLFVGPFELPYDVENFSVGDKVVAQGTVLRMMDGFLQIANGHIVEKAKQK